jgi:hypothetical protein
MAVHIADVPLSRVLPVRGALLACPRTRHWAVPQALDD